MINLTDKIQMTYNAGFIVIKIVKENKDGDEYLSNALTYLKPESARKGILKHTDVDVPVERIEQAMTDLIKQAGIESAIVRKEAALAKLNKTTGQVN